VKFSKAIVALVIMLNVVFAAAVLYVFLETKAEPTVLIGAWFSFTTAELLALAGIKRKKIKGKENGDEKN